MKKNGKRIVLLFAVAALAVSVRCKNPFDWGPDDDDLVPPPDPPALVSPVNKVTFYGPPWPQQIQLEWSAVEDAETYEVGISHYDSTFTNMQIISSTSPECPYTIRGNDTTYWRVRAYSTKWEWYTEWSEAWKFISYTVTSVTTSHNDRSQAKD